MDFAREPVELGAWQERSQAQDGLPTLQNAYLGRLRRLLRLRSDHYDDLNDQGLWLLDRSIFATYRDCRGLGAGFVAQDLIRRLSPQSREPPRPATGGTGDPARPRRR